MSGARYTPGALLLLFQNSYKPVINENMANTNVRPGNHTNEIRRLATLLEVSQALSGALSLKTVSTLSSSSWSGAIR